MRLSKTPDQEIAEAYEKILKQEQKQEVKEEAKEEKKEG